MQNPSSTWSIILAFSDDRGLRAPENLDPGAWARAAALDTITAVTSAVEPANVVVVSDDATVRTGATGVGAIVHDRGPDLNVAMTSAITEVAGSHPQRSAAALLGPFPYADTDTIMAMLRACAATESALVVADDGGTVALTHHDPARLAPRFGGSSAERHQRFAVSVGSHLVQRLSRDADEAQLPAGEHAARLLADAGTGR